LHVDDLAKAACFAMENYEDAAPLNVGVGEDLSIAELAGIVARVVGYSGAVRFDPSMPDGTPRKLLDVSRIQALGWRAAIGLEEGIASTYKWYRANVVQSGAAVK
ncbi:MAG TPA: GDP-L-fucose synthase, partial [Bryobacteraceae bacterium]